MSSNDKTNYKESYPHLHNPGASGPHVQVLALHALSVSPSVSCPYLHSNITE